MRSSTLLRLSAVLAHATLSSARYTIADTYDASNFFSAFSFFNGADPTHGFVQYVDGNTASRTGLAGNSNNQVYLGVDHTTMNPSAGRASTRVTSNKAYTHGLFIADIAHMPSSTCGVWPAFWTFGSDWPRQGEIDIIEGVNTQSTDSVTLHTSDGCSMSNSGSASGSNMLSGNCNEGNAGTGCSQTTQASYGTPFNQAGGGVYAMEWTDQHIGVWFFPRSSIPGDIQSGNPNPAGWGSSTALFSGSGCNIDQHFANHNIIFDTTFCGDWAGNVWGSNSQCSSMAGSCVDYVKANPNAFADAYWLINSVKVYSGGVAKKREANETIVDVVGREAKSFLA